jgi:hypothetical protein
MGRARRDLLQLPPEDILRVAARLRRIGIAGAIGFGAAVLILRQLSEIWELADPLAPICAALTVSSVALAAISAFLPKAADAKARVVEEAKGAAAGAVVQRTMSGGSSGSAAAGFVILAVVVWFVIHAWSSVRPLKDPIVQASAARPRYAFIRATEHALSPASIRFDERRAGNAVVYIDRDEFEAIPFPDRPAFMRAAASAWCLNLDHRTPWNYVFLPSVNLRDIKTGKGLADYKCV